MLSVVRFSFAAFSFCFRSGAWFTVVLGVISCSTFCLARSPADFLAESFASAIPDFAASFRDPVSSRVFPAEFRAFKLADLKSSFPSSKDFLTDPRSLENIPSCAFCASAVVFSAEVEADLESSFFVSTDWTTAFVTVAFPLFMSLISLARTSRFLVRSESSLSTF